MVTSCGLESLLGRRGGAKISLMIQTQQTKANLITGKEYRSGTPSCDVAKMYHSVRSMSFLRDSVLQILHIKHMNIIYII